MSNSEFLTRHSEFTAPGWERDENGALRRVKKPCGSAALEDGAGHEPTWVVEPSAMGQAALDCWRKITDFWPQVSLIEAQLMPEHFHGILFVKERLPLTYPDRPEGPGNRRKALGDIIAGPNASMGRRIRGYHSFSQGPACENDQLPSRQPAATWREARAPRALQSGA